MCTQKPKKGSILIEFTFSIPVCITLLFFISDHYRFYELQNKIKTSTYFAASIIQQIKNTKTNKQLSKKDFADIAYASSLNFFHTNTIFKPWPFGIYYALICAWVKRVNSNSYQYQKCYGTTSTSGASPDGMNQGCTNVETKTSSQIQAINPDLICDKDGEERLVVECCYRKASGFNKKKLGFFLIEPKLQKDTIDNINNFFRYQLVITPKPGLFPGTN